MLRYYFDIRDPDGIVIDHEGMVFPTLRHAIKEAERALREMAEEEPTAEDMTVLIDIRLEGEVVVSVTRTANIVPFLR